MRVNKNPDWIGPVQPDNRIKHVNKMDTSATILYEYIVAGVLFN